MTRSRLPLGAIGVLLVAAALRLWQLGAVPPGFQFDEAYNAIDAAAVLDGAREWFFPANGGREPMATYLHAPLLALLGRDNAPYALRLVSAFAGILTVAVTAIAIGTILGSRRHGVLAAAFMAASVWHIHFSRFGIRAILAPLWTAAALGCWWVATHAPRRAHRLAAAAVSGVGMAAAVYSHPSGRLLPLLLVIHVAARAPRHALWGRTGAVRTWWDDLASVAVAGVVAAALFAPLGMHFVKHPDHFLGHPSDVSLVAVADADHGGSVRAAATTNVAAVMAMFFIAGDPSTFHNIPNLPVFDPGAALLAVLGLGVLAAAVVGTPGGAAGPLDASARQRAGVAGPLGASARERAGFLLLWLGVMLLPTLLSDRPPNYSRAIAALPAVVALPALGAAWVLARLAPRGRAALLLAPATVAVSAAWAWWHLFVVFPQLDQVYDSYDMEIVDAYQALTVPARHADTYVHPLYAQHATFAFLNADGPVMELDGSETLVVRRRDRPVAVAFPDELDEAIAAAAEFLGNDGLGVASPGERGSPPATPSMIRDAKGEPLLWAFHVAPSAWGDMAPPTDALLEPHEWIGATFATASGGEGGAIRLVGATIGAARRGEPLPVRLVWESLSPIDTNLTVFVQLTDSAHMTDGVGRPAGQLDREPGRASFRTTAWRPGDLVIDQYAPIVEALASGPLHINIGWYNVATGERLAVTAITTAEGARTAPDGTTSVILGPVDLDP